jgi:hypothetical protein
LNPSGRVPVLDDDGRVPPRVPRDHGVLRRHLAGTWRTSVNSLGRGLLILGSRKRDSTYSLRSASANKPNGWRPPAISRLL